MSIHETLLTPQNDVFSDVAEALKAVRELLDMDWAYLSEFKADSVVIRVSDSQGGQHPVPAGYSLPKDQTFCGLIADGQLPDLIPDTEDLSTASQLPLTQAFPIRSLVSTPILRSNGEPYGMFCCSSSRPNKTLNARDRDVVRLFSKLAARRLNAHLDDIKAKKEMRQQITDVIRNKLLEVHLQPIVSLRAGEVRAVEALSRIPHPPQNAEAEGGGIQWWFEQAFETQLQVPFELNAVAVALSHLPHLPPPTYLTINVSPATFASRRLRRILEQVPPDRLVIELTEHLEIAETTAVMQQLEWLRERRIGIAVDDVGAGYSGLTTILKLRPDVIKLDRELIKNIDQDPAKQSLVHAMLAFATQLDAFLIAEGIETLAEHLVLHGMGVRLAQGYAYCRPKPATDMIDRLLAANRCFLPEAPQEPLI